MLSRGIVPKRKIVLLFSAAAFLFSLHASLAHADVYIASSSLQALYHFNNQDLTDSSGKGRDGTQGSTPFLFTTTSTKLGAAAGNDQSTGFFTATSTIMDLTGDFTIGFWMQPKVTLTGGVYFLLRNTGGQNNNTGITYAIACSAGHIEFIHNGTCEIDTAQTFNTGTWYWILMERQGSRLDAYVNDLLLQSVTDSVAVTSTVAVRFNGEVGGTGTANMLYDEIFLTNTAISTSTRDSLWNSSSGAEICTTVGCGSTSTPAAPYITTSTLGQFLSDASTTLGVGSSTTDNVVVFKGTPMSSSSDQLQLQIEIEPSNTAFINASSVTSAIVSSGNGASVSSTNLANGSYHWQARVLDNGTAATSTWARFGANATGTDFVVNAPRGVEISDGSVQALYHFDDQALTDSSGNKRNGTQGTSTVIFTSTSTKVGAYAISTNGGNGSFNAVSSTINLAGDFTLGFWINPQAPLSGTYLGFKNTPSVNDNTGVSYSIGCTANHFYLVELKEVLVGAVGIENNDERNFKDLRGMRRNTKSLKWNKRICKGILIAPSKLPRLSLVVDILRVDFSIHCLHCGRLRVEESRHGWLADSSLGQRGCPSARKRDLARLPWAPQ